MGKLAKSLKHSIWYASKILNGTRYAEQNQEVRSTPWGEGGIASCMLLRTSFIFISSPVQSTGRAIVLTLTFALALPLPSRHF